ncbi:AAA family ATPase [Pseudomonas sp. B33.4]|uniref:AAA family ATPase n=1 Tax=Pseudomonas sp. B33.4 TaxID=3104265 RepID=UPI002ADEE9C2|nr:AAA family ATPase [Pseudomonas sp. B33.4]
MREVCVDLKNCYGIKSLDYKFDFGNPAEHKKSFAIYAPNGLMKTSFTKTFENLAAGGVPKEERFNRIAKAVVRIDNAAITSQCIHVLKSEIDLSQESPEMSNILVNPDKKTRYDSLVLDIEKQKIKCISSLQKLSGVPKKDIEVKILKDIGQSDFFECLSKLSEDQLKISSTPPYNYAAIFDDKVTELLSSKDFLINAKEFSERYQQVFTQDGTIFKKDIFNPIKAERSFATLKSQGYFEGGHLLYLRGDCSPVGIDEVEERVKVLLAKIEEDERLKSIKDNISNNTQTQAIASLFESLPMSDIEILLDGLKPENQGVFKSILWRFYLENSPETITYLSLYSAAKEEIDSIEKEAAVLAPEWSAAVNLFNDRFTDMPFRLLVENHVQAALGKERAKLAYMFKDDDGKEVKLGRNELKTLSQGEKRALYLLNFIFEVEAKTKLNNETIFIIDDVADSFDYKNKHAIIQYLEDIEGKANVYQIILTHNYDFFRSLTKFVHRKRCLMANKHPDRIELVTAEGVENYFIGILKRDFHKNLRAMCAAIPFTRNIIEYTKGDKHPEYLKLTSLLHQKDDTDAITHKDFVDIYNSTFCCQHPGIERSIKDIIFEQAEAISGSPLQTGLNLEDKVVMSMAIRLKAEFYMLEKIRGALNNPNYWCTDHGQFGKLLGQYIGHYPKSLSIPALRKVSVTVSSNIHLNSFMYEPILDLSIGHLSELYKDVKSL